MVAGSAQILFDTPVPSVIPSDSFANDYELSEYRRAEKDLKLAGLADINNSSKASRAKLTKRTGRSSYTVSSGCDLCEQMLPHGTKKKSPAKRKQKKEN
jgi:hypothetical protein